MPKPSHQIDDYSKPESVRRAELAYQWQLAAAPPSNNDLRQRLSAVLTDLKARPRTTTLGVVERTLCGLVGEAISLLEYLDLEAKTRKR